MFLFSKARSVIRMMEQLIETSLCKQAHGSMGSHAAMTDLFCYFYFSLACPQDSRAGLPRFARPGRDWIHLVYI